MTSPLPSDEADRPPLTDPAPDGATFRLAGSLSVVGDVADAIQAMRDLDKPRNDATHNEPGFAEAVAEATAELEREQQEYGEAAAPGDTPCGACLEPMCPGYTGHHHVAPDCHTSERP